MPAGPDVTASPFAGELFRALAADGRLRLDARQADAAIEGLELTLSEARARLRILQIHQRTSADPSGELSDDLVNAVFADQLAPGRLELAIVEIPKYIEALRRARTRST